MLHRNRENNPKIHMEAQKTPNSQSNPKQRAMLDVPQYIITNYSTEPH
jgi:hypothetical protein